MANRRRRPGESVTRLRQLGALVQRGMARLDALSAICISWQISCRWKRQCGGMGTGQTWEPERLQNENERLTQALSKLTMDTLIPAEAVSATSVARPVIAPASIKLSGSESRFCRVDPPIKAAINDAWCAAR